MEDNRSAEDTTVLGKRRRSASNLVPSTLPTVTIGHEDSAPSSHEGSALTNGEPAAKKPHLPPKPPVSVARDSPLSIHDRPTSLEHLPPGVLQYIFSFVPPRSLQCLLHVSRLCRALLVPACSLPAQPDGSKDLPLLPQDALWKAARMRYFPVMPKPMAGHSEYDSFMLILNRSCQFCGNLPPPHQSHNDPYKAGPGASGVRIIWPFRIRSCFPCLKNRIKEDTQVFVSGASTFRTGLPFAPLTPGMDYIPLHLLFDPDKPRNLIVEKYFYIPQIDQILEEAKEAHGYGQAAAENWLKDLEPRRQELEKDYGRFEKWDNPRNLGLVRRHQSGVHQEMSTSNFEGVAAVTAVSRKPLINPQTSDAHSARSLNALAPLDFIPEMPLRDYGMAPGQEPVTIYQTAGFRTGPAGPHLATSAAQSSAHERERARIRADRRDQILKRSAELDPPIDAETLMSMDAFDAAMQIARPLSDADWETLKTRLLKEQGKLDAEQDVRDSVTVAPIPGQFNIPENSDQYVLTHLDQPIRDKLFDIADVFIRHRWNFGSLVAYPNAPQFAAEVLLHVRDAYVRLKQREDTMHLQQLMPSVTTSTEDRVLRLEHMKWVFSKTIQPRTEQIRNDLFLCGECPASTSKFYAFDSVIQHYASKHTDAFSRGTQKVYWKAEWPEKPPFNPHPERAHTPAPALTHTPTLSHAQPEHTSPAPVRNAPPSNMDWRSIQSITTDTRSITSYNADSWSLPSNAPPGLRTRPTLYNVQRDMFTNVLAIAWREATKISGMPRSLQLFIALQEAHDAFTQKYTNHPSLSLLLDCVRRRPELLGIKSISDLRCRECLLNPQNKDLRFYTLQSLLEHFQSAHVAELQDGQKLQWWLDMVDLPNPDTIREVQALPEVAPSFHKALQEALLVALSAPEVMATAISTGMDVTGYNHPDFTSGRVPITAYGDWSPMTVSESRAISDVRLPPRSPSQTLVDSASVQQIQSSHAFKQGVRNPDIESMHSIDSLPKRPPSRTDVVQSAKRRHLHSTFDTQAEFIALSDTPADTPPRATQASLSEAEPMTRSNTALRAPLAATQAEPDDSTSRFLADFETVVAANDQASVKAGSSTRPSRPESRTGTVPVSRTLRESGGSDPLDADVELQHGIAERRFDAHWPEPPQDIATGRSSYDPGVRELRDVTFPRSEYPEEPRELQRAPSRFVEYDDRGLPIQTQERRYYPISPRMQQYPVTYVDQYGRPVEVVPRREVQYMEVPAHQEQYINDPYYDPRRHQPVEYVRVRAYEDERMIDRGTGQYIVEESRPRPRFIELDTGFTEPRPAHQRRPTARSIYRQVQQTSGAVDPRQQARDVRYTHAPDGAYEPAPQGGGS